MNECMFCGETDWSVGYNPEAGGFDHVECYESYMRKQGWYDH